MRLSVLPLILLLITTKFVEAQIRLSDEAQISVVTMGPYYEELYAAFGHSAIHVYDPVNNIDLAYNYGTFDFDQPNFYLNFARGSLLYKLAVQDYQRLRKIYTYYNRFIHEQILDLNQAQKQKVFDFLQNNALPENSEYYYDYFYDNCASRIRDVFEETLGKDIRFDGSYIENQRSIRELTDDYLIGYYPWGDLGIDLCLGLPMDKVLEPREYMFLPDYVESAFDNAWINTTNGERPIVKEKVSVFESEEREIKKTFFTPTLVFLFLFLVVVFITRSQMKKQKRGKYLDFTVFTLVGILGILLTLLWFATDHKAAMGNMNMIWAFPVHMIAGIIVTRKILSPGWIKYFRITAIVLAILLVSWPVIPQSIPTSLMFISAIIMVRAAYIGWGSAYDKNSLARE